MDLFLVWRLARFCTLGPLKMRPQKLHAGADGALPSVRNYLCLTGHVQWMDSFGNQRDQAVPFTPILTILGGTIFGAGMAFAGNCGFGALSRLGGGDLRSFVIVLVMGITTYTVSSGVFSSINAWLRDIFTISHETPGFVDPIVSYSGAPSEAIGLLVGFIS